VSAAAGLALKAACGRSAPVPPAVATRHLVVVTVGTLRADRVGIYGYGAGRAAPAVSTATPGPPGAWRSGGDIGSGSGRASSPQSTPDDGRHLPMTIAERSYRTTGEVAWHEGCFTAAHV
jgi:hypothetical protein